MVASRSRTCWLVSASVSFSVDLSAASQTQATVTQAAAAQGIQAHEGVPFGAGRGTITEAFADSLAAICASNFVLSSGGGVFNGRLKAMPAAAERNSAISFWSSGLACTSASKARSSAGGWAPATYRLANSS